MAYVRLAALVIALLGFVVIGIPAQVLALKLNSRLSSRIPQVFHRTMCRILRVRVRVHGRATDAVPQMIVANHVSWVDILALSSQRPLQFLAKTEVRSWPVFGTFAILQRSVFVDRSKVAELPSVNAEIARRMVRGEKLVLFAEATTGDGTKMLRFRPAHLGAMETLLTEAPQVAAVTIQPAAISYVVLDGHAVVPWYGDMQLVPHIWTLLRGGPYDCDIDFATPIRFDRTSSRKAAMAAAQDAVGALLAARTGQQPCQDTPSSLLLFDEKH